MDHWSNVPQDDFLEFKPSYPHMNSQQPTSSPTTSVVSSVVAPPSSLYPDPDALQQLKLGFAKMMETMERLEKRLNKVEQTTSQILKNQQETLQVPFMSQTDLDKARLVAEQMEQDTNVAKQLQAAYNKETEIRKNLGGGQHQITQYSGYGVQSQECPLCGARVGQAEIHQHVDQCLGQFQDDPKKQAQVAETKKKVDQGFFGRMLKFNTTSTKTETKVTTQHQTTAAPSDMTETSTHPPYAYPPSFGYPQVSYAHAPSQGNGMAPMMMPMYMYPSYPNGHMTQLHDQ